MAWSFDLLDDAALAGLIRFGAFRGGASLEAAESVLAAAPIDWPLDTILESLGDGEALGESFVQLWSVEWLAVTEVEQGHPQVAAVLVGACRRARETQAGWTPAVYGLEETRSRLDRVMSPDEIDRLIEFGGSIDFSDAIRLARHQIRLTDLEELVLES